MIHKVRCPICLLTTLKKYLVLVLNEIAASLCHHFSKKYYSWLFKKWPQKCYFWCVCFTHPLKSCAHTNQTNEMVLFHVKKGKISFLYWETNWGNWPKSWENAWEPRKNRPKKKKNEAHSWKKKSSSCSSFCFPTSSNNTSLHCNFP